MSTISAKTHSQNTILLPPVRHHYSSSLERWDAKKKRSGREYERDKPPPVPGSARLKYWSRMVTLRERKPAQYNHISINQLSSKVNRGLIREQSAEHLFLSAFSLLPGKSVSMNWLAKLWLRWQKHGTQAAVSHPSNPTAMNMKPMDLDRSVISCKTNQIHRSHDDVSSVKEGPRKCFFFFKSMTDLRERDSF